MNDDVKWLKNLHAWGIVFGLPVFAWMLTGAAKAHRRDALGFLGDGR